MKNKILIPLLILGALATFFSFRYSGDDASVSGKRETVLKTVMRAINEGHFSPRPIDDSLSASVYKKVLDIDYEKKFFTQKDIDQLAPYKYQIDDQINRNSIEFFNKFNELFTKSIDRADGYYKEILDKPFTFTGNERIESDGEKVSYAPDEAALKLRWNNYLKYRVLAKYVELKNDQDKKAKDSSNYKAKPDADLEADARTSIRKNQDYFFKRLRKMKEEDRFTYYINSIAGSEDPHTDYLPPREKEMFDQSMSGTFVGIGAVLQNDEGKIKIASIIPGSPCWKQGQLKAGDEILKVAQGAEEPVDIQGYDTEDAVKLIRGRKGSEVRLTVKKVNSATMVIPIIRGEVLIEETFAKSAIINSPSGPIGYIYLPEFYSDFQHSDGRKSGEDVKLEVMKLKNAGVTGIILDLRYNGGGSLGDVVDMAGLFIDEGPVVQVKSANSAPVLLRDPQQGVLYDGPLAVMVNQGSASASEIMAAALQDYKRAVIVGTPTFGKGTVQKIIPLDDYKTMLENFVNQDKGTASTNSIGSLKITVQKFYRVNGGSTQLKGVTPDIALPDPYMYINLGERKDPASLKWDQIPAAQYRMAKNPVNVNTLAAESKKRVAANPTFSLIEANAQRLKKQESENSVSLNEVIFRKEQEEATATNKKMEELEKKATALTIVNPKEDMARINLDSTSVNKNNEWIKNLRKDIYLSETVNIIKDIAKQNQKVNLGTGMK